MSFTDQRLIKFFGVDVPIIQAGMVWAAGAKLAAAVSNAGGLGLIGSGSMKPDLLRDQIRKARSLTDKPFGVNIPLLRGDSDELVQAALEEEVRIFFTSAGSPKKFTPMLKERDCRVVHVVPTVAFAKKVEEAGCDAVVAEGFEAGGHNGIDEVTTFALLPQVVDAVNIPVIAAGGITDGRGIAAALALGAAGVQMGTRFAATVESSAHDNYKRAVVESGDTSTTLLLSKIGPARMIRNEWTARIAEVEARGASAEELRELLGSKRERLGIFEGNLAEGQVEAGQGAGLIREIPTAGELIQRLVAEYEATIKRLSGDNQ
jgi:enoyl-[acyl-carrier protein] reductase II